MNSREAVEYLFKLKRFGMKEGFDRTLHLLDELGNPHEELDGVQVGGTNGKGSVAAMVESCLRRDGYSVGLYTSPHMTELGERVRVDGDEMTRRRIRDFVEKVRDTVEAMIDEGDPPTFFEVTTVMALHEFARRDVDFAVLEVGLGGRFDTTSVCPADVAAVTSVDLEHTDVLGETVEDIAWEIGHVIPEGGVCVTGASGDPLDVLVSMADERGAELAAVGDSVGYEPKGRDGYEQVVEVERDGALELRLPLLGAHQAHNAAVAVGVLDELGVGDDAVREGMRRVDWRGRFEVVETEPFVVLDAAHNPAGVEALVSTLGDFDYDELHVVFGSMADKDTESMAAKLARAGTQTVYTASPSTPRAEEAEALENVFASQAVDARSFGNVPDATDAAVASAGDADAVVVTGSIFTVGEARKRWSRRGVAKTYADEAEAVVSLEASGVRDASSVAADGVHRSVHLRGLNPDDAHELRDVAESVGAEVALSAHDAPEMYVDATLMATLSQHRAIAEEMERVGRSVLDSVRPTRTATQVMGILNVTPDSFYDGGRYEAHEDAVERGREMVDKGADIVDIGGESTRPGAEPVPPDEEAERVVPVVEELAELDVPLSVDTRHPSVAREALDAGAEIVNDVTGLDDPEMRRLVADEGSRVVVMDSVNVPVDPSARPEYDDVVDDVADRLIEKVIKARRAGVDDDQIILDPGIGFGKGSEGDAEILRRTDEFASLGYPVLIGCSRKSFLGEIASLPKDDRLEASVAANVVAAVRGASVVRVHDVEETVKAVKTADALSSLPPSHGSDYDA